MPGRDNFSRLHDDLVTIILVRLPPKQVARVRLVCRRWLALTTDHHFVRARFSRQHAGNGHSIAGFFYTHRLAFVNDYFPLEREADKEAPAGHGRSHQMQVLGSCGGLLLVWCALTQGGTFHCVCNPMTKKHIRIVLPTSAEFCVNLAFDPSKSQHYKVIALDDMHCIHIYSSQTRSWRMAIHSDHSVDLLHGVCPTRGVFWNGSVVWIVAHSLVRFDTEEEHVTKMPMPPRGEDWICAYIGESGGHLQLIGYTKKDKLTACFDILEMQGNKSEWSVLYRIDLSRVKELYPDIAQPTWDTRYHQHKIIDYLALSPIYVIRGTGKTGQHGVLVFSIPGRIMSYNIEDKEISMVKEIAACSCPLEEFWYSFHAYNPSLFAL